MGFEDVKRMNEFYATNRGEQFNAPITIEPVTDTQKDEFDEEIAHFTAQNNMDDTERLMELIRMLIEKAWGDEAPNIVDEYPTNQDPNERDFPMIVYDSFDREHAEHTKKSPVVIDKIKFNGDVYEILLEIFDCTLEFNILSTTTRNAKVVAKRFEIFMQTYMQYFKYAGVSQIWFDKEPRPMQFHMANQIYPKRTLQYKVRLHRNFIRRYGETMGTIQVVLGLETNVDSPGGLPGVKNVVGNSQLSDILDKQRR